MEKYLKSQDGLNIHYRISELRNTAIVFIHGWLGNTDWWNNQYEYFKDRYTVTAVDLPGHGKSQSGRVSWSSAHYSNDIKEVVEHIPSEDIVLVGHSMSGAYALQASLIIPRVKLIVLVDTLKNMDKLMDLDQAEAFLFKTYKQDFNSAVKTFLPKFIFAESSPLEIKQQLQAEFLRYEVDFAIKSIEPLYKMNVREIAKQVAAPVRAINSGFAPTDVNSIRKYIKDFDYVNISNSGHYPMIENPQQFNLALDEIIQTFTLK